MEVLEHPAGRSWLPTPRALAAVLAMLLVSATTVLLWARKPIRENPTDLARSMTAAPDDVDRTNAVVVLLRDVRRSIDALKALEQANDGSSSAQAAAALRDIRNHLR